MHLQLNNTSPTIQLKKNISIAEKLDAFLRFYRHIRKYLGKQLSKFLLTIISPIIYILLYLVRSRIQKYSANIIINTDNYVDYRHSYDKLSHLIQKIDIDNISDDDIKNIPFYVRYIVKEFLLIVKVIKETHNNLGAALKDINKNSPKSDFFTLRTESELWESRNKSYDYLR